MISINIIVKNDRRIGNLLNRLHEIDKPEKTEIIVIDASKKETLLDIKKKFPKIRWFYFENKTSKRFTYSEQRNMGIRKSNGDIIVFIDSDCMPVNDWLIEMIKPIRKNKENMVAGAINMGYMNIIKPKSNYILRCGTGNVAYSKDLINKIGGYDESFEASGDGEFCIRVRKAGYKIFYNYKAVVDHPQDKFKKTIKNGYIHGIGEVNILKKHPDQLTKLSSDLVYTILYPLYILLLPLTLIWSYYPLLILIPVVLHYKRNPLKEIVNLAFGLGVLRQLFFPKKIKS